MLVSTQGELPALLVTATGALARAAPVAPVPMIWAVAGVLISAVPPPLPPPAATVKGKNAHAGSGQGESIEGDIFQGDSFELECGKACILYDNSLRNISPIRVKGLPVGV